MSIVTPRSLGSKLAIIGIAVALAACDETPREFLTKPRMEARWQSLTATRLTLEGTTGPEDWSAGIFLGKDVIAAALTQLAGTRIDYIGPNPLLQGAVVEVKAVSLTPELGQAGAEMRLVATRGNLSLDLGLTGMVSFLGIGRPPGKSEDEPAEAAFRIEPLSISTEAHFGPFWAKLREFWTTLAPDLLVALSRPDTFQIKFPVEDRIEVALKVAKEGREVVNKDTGAIIGYRASMPESRLVERITYAAPVFRPEGVWLLARSSARGQVFALPPRPPEMSMNQLEDETRRLAEALNATTGRYAAPADRVGVRIGRDIFERFAEQIAALPAPQRTMIVQSTSREGQLAQGRWRDNLLGEGGYYAELVGDRSASAEVQFGRPTVHWVESGLSMTLPTQAAVKADIKLHFDPLIGGGMGTSVGLSGSGSGKVTLTTAPRVLAAQDVTVAVLESKLSCDAVDVSLATDGRLKIDLGWIKVPALGVKGEIPIGRDKAINAALLDGSPVFIGVQAKDPRRVADEQERTRLIGINPWAVVPAKSAFKVKVVPRTFASDDRGYHADATIAVEALNVGPSEEDLERARQAVNQERAAMKAQVAALLEANKPVQDCQGEARLAVLIGSVEIGPQNEVVKFARNAWHDITRGPGPNNELRRLVERAEKALEPVTPYIAVGKNHGGLGVQIGKWKF